LGTHSGATLDGAPPPVRTPCSRGAFRLLGSGIARRRVGMGAGA
jgi:hypothetical protein